MNQPDPNEPLVSMTVFEMSGDETDEQCQSIAWQMFCNAHPVEAHAHDPERFWKYFQTQAPGVSREEMEKTLKECEQAENN